MSYGIRFQWAGGLALRFDVDVPVGAWLARYDPEDDTIEWTTDPAQAMRFDTGAEAVLCYRRQSRAMPLRPDGEANRPLTAYTVGIEALP